MVTTTHSSSGTLRRGYNAAEDFRVTLVPRAEQLSSAGSVIVANKDANLARSTTASIRTYSDVRLELQSNIRLAGVPTFTSGSNALAIDPSGRITSTADASATVTVNVPPMGSRRVTASVVTAPPATGDAFASYVTGSLGRHLADTITTSVSGKAAPAFSPAPVLLNTTTVTASTPLTNIFASGTSGPYNTSAWFGGLDLTAVSAPGAFSGVAITPRHMLIAAHYVGGTVGLNSTVYFTDAGGVTAGYGVTTIALIAGTDIMLCLLGSPLASGVTPMKVLPSNYAAKLPTGYGYPAVFTNQDRRLLIGKARFYGATMGVAQAQQATDPLYPWFYGIRVYDSGSPMMLIVNGSPVFLGTFTGGGSDGGGGPNVAAHVPAINAAIAASSSPGYGVSTVDLSSYSSF